MVLSVKKLRDGEAAVLPGGWLGSNSGRHVVMYVVFRRQERFDFAVCNTGDGVQQVREPIHLCPIGFGVG